MTVTPTAVTMPSAETGPTARTVSPVHTSAKDGALTPFSVKVVDVDPTSTAYPVLFDARVKFPATPALPHVPGAVVPFTEVTVPDRWWWLWTCTVVAAATELHSAAIAAVLKSAAPTAAVIAPAPTLAVRLLVPMGSRLRKTLALI